jgi:hypothetical protein
MTVEDPFDGFERDLNYWELPDEVVPLAVDDADGRGEDRRLRFVLYAGLFDLLVDALWESCHDDEERERRLSRVLSKLQSVEPTLRFWLCQNRQRAEGLELVTRMRGKDISMTEEWMLPRLERDIAIYRDRIGALKAVLEERAG